MPPSLTPPPRFSVAAGVYNALAMRLSGPGDSTVTLEERLQAFQDALMQVRRHGSGEQAGGGPGSQHVVYTPTARLTPGRGSS